MDMNDIPINQRKWHIVIELSNGQVSYNSIILADLSKYIRKERKKQQYGDGKVRKLKPVLPWIVEVIFKDCKNMLTLYRNKPGIKNIKITPGIRENHGKV